VVLMRLDDTWADARWAAVVLHLVENDAEPSSYAGQTGARDRRGPAPPAPHPLSFDASGFPVAQSVPTLTERLRRLTSAWS
jgi:hypothetical protein